MKKLLSALLVIWVLLVVIGGISHISNLGKYITGDGPQALSSDEHGGFFLISNRQILHFDAHEKIQARHDLDELGLLNANSLLYREGELLIFDNERQQIFRCTLPAWQCKAFTPPSLGLSNAISMTWQSPSTLAVSDNTGHRLLLLDTFGNALYAGTAAWHYPNQISATSDGLLLADTNRLSILHIADIAGAKPETLLRTLSRPYQFVHRDDSWWVLQAGVRLENADLYRYRAGIPEKISLPATDPVALMDRGDRLIIASRQDWQLLSLDPDTGKVQTVGDSAFQQALSIVHQAQQKAIKQRGRAPYIMLALMLPALLGGVVLQKRMNKEADVGKTSALHFSAANSTGSAPAYRIDTDKSGVEMQRLQQNRKLIIIGLIIIPLLVLLGLLLWFSRIDLPGLQPLFFMLFSLTLLLPLLVYLGRRKQDKLFDQHLICGPQKLVHIKQGKPVSATPYADIWLGSDTLLLKGNAFPLYMGYGKLRTAFWMTHDVQREIGKRIPAAQLFHSDHEMGKAMLGKHSILGLRLILARYAIAGIIALVLLLKLMQLLHHFHLDKLWKIFHPS
ncbi:MAG: hypothetical protein ACRERR_05565 [Moraxellaceae bacterium]